MGVVVVHEPGSEVAALPAVRDLAGQVDELLLIHNGHDVGPGRVANARPVPGARSIRFDANLGTAAAWNAALSAAGAWGCDYMYLLDQDSVPSSDAVGAALAEISIDRIAAVVQPATRDRFRLDPFPWNTVASGSLLDVQALLGVGGFDERLFVDEVDHEMLARLMRTGHSVRMLPQATIRHETGSPRSIRFLRTDAVISGHSVERRRLQGFSAGLLARRYLPQAPATSGKIVLRHSLTAAKDFVAGEREASWAHLSGLIGGAATSEPPPRAAERACPYCAGPLLGRFGEVSDWRFGTGVPGDVYRCATCGALAAGRVPGQDVIASWYETYYTHDAEPVPSRLWSRLWPTPARRHEQERLRWYFADPGAGGRLLEVGTGSGERLLRFADAGWDVVGQDLDPKAGHLVVNREIKVHRCPVDELVGREQPFDLIGLNHVLEHVPDPAALLRACASLLAPGGRICVISPNADGLGRRVFGRWWYGLEQPRHLAIPTLASMARVASTIELETLQLTSMATNGAVILGGSLDRHLGTRLPPGRPRRAIEFALHLLGQATGRAAIMLHDGLGEEVVWVGQRSPG
jgi:2-polyprenyl-3-methyl-5-hydroxy-6-metoxy-1,4-benzoquinol methylase